MKFEVGKQYECSDSGFDPITITKRTDKTVWVNNGHAAWKMRIWLDENGDEFVTDSSVPKKWRNAFTYSAKWERSA